MIGKFLKTKSRLRLFNDFLTLVLIVLALYIFALPLIPQLSWYNTKPTPIARSHQHVVTPQQAVVYHPSGNELVIPSINLNQHIFTGTSIYTVNLGVWMRPNGSTPDKGSNTIFVGHRFTYTNPRGVFYFLGNIHIGDSIVVYWQNKTYMYQVNQIKVVVPTDTTVEDPTNTPIITLYTCTPLWSLKDRLVIIASEVSVQ